MADILQIFSGNPLSTFMGKKIEAATSLELESDDWSLNLEICDFINENDDDGKDAIRAIRRRLQQVEQDTNFTVTNRTLTVLETCVNNCSHRFHVLAMHKEFIQELVKLIGPKNNPPIDLQERVLRMIQKWADAFKSQPDLAGVVTVYNELKAKGVTFPAPDSTTSIGPPIQTPQRTVPQRNNSPRIPPPSSQQGPTQAAGSQVRPPNGPPVILEGEGYNKITQDLNVVKTSIEMFSDILKVVDKANTEQSDWNLAGDLANTCRKMKERIVELIEQIGNEDLTIELLGLNDELNNIFIKYDKLLEKRNSQTNIPRTSQASSSRPVQQQAAGPIAPTTASAINPTPMTSTTPSTTPSLSTALPRPRNEPTLIDFEESAEENLDPFAPTPKQGQQQQQKLTDNLNRMTLNSQAGPTGSNDTSATAATLPKEISNLKEQDFAEIENWLSSDAGRDATMAADQAGPASLASPEFENFIANRAMAATGSSSSSGTKSTQSKQREPAT